MGEKMESFKQGLDVEAARKAVPEMSSYEQPYYRSSPSFLSMFPRYVLVFVVFSIHMLFWWGASMNGPSGEGGLNSFLSILHGLSDLFGVTGFFVLMLFLTWCNNFVNFSTSGRWYTISLLLISLTPGFFFLEWVFTDGPAGVLIGLVAETPTGFLPDWNDSFYLYFGVIYSSVMFVLTVMYQRAFTYVITDKQVYLKKEFLKFIDANSHAISLTKIENLKVERSLIGRMLGYGSLHVITASGMGLREDSISVGTGAASEITDAATNQSSNFFIRMIRLMFVVIRLQRTRTTVDLDPEDCFYGIRKPMDVYALVNELRTRPGAPEDEASSSPSVEVNPSESSEIELVE